MTNRTFVLPSKEEMLRRLLEVDDDNYLQQKFYPKLLEEAGFEKVADGVVMLLQLAIFDLSPSLQAVMNTRIPDFIDALCPNEDDAEEAKAFFEQTLTAK